MRNRIPFFGSTGENYLTRDNVLMVSSIDDGPRRKLKRNAIRSQECKAHKHRACSSSPCNCPCHKAQPGGVYK